MKSSWRGIPLFLIALPTASSVRYLLFVWVSLRWLGIDVLLFYYSHSCGINVPITGFECFDHGFFLGMFILPCTEANGWNLRAGVEFEFGGHIDGRAV